jgi:IS5 family transposase
MVVDRYAPVNLFESVPQQARVFEPELRELDRLLEDDALFPRVQADLSRRRPQRRTRGRPRTPVEVVLRLLVVKRLYRWSDEQPEHWVGDRLVLRQFCRLDWERVPDDTTLRRWAPRIGPQTLEPWNGRGWSWLSPSRSRAGASGGSIAR